MTDTLAEDLDHAAFSRVLPFQGVYNFRDYGGYAARGGRLRTGRLYRSAQHRSATPNDLERVAALHLKTVIDLRGPAERASAPCPRPQGFDAEVIVVAQDTTGLAPHLQAAGAALGAQDARQAMLRSYAGMPFRTRMIPVLIRYFEALARTDGATLVHCMAGKDRTGLTVALLHHVLGVHRDDLMADYLLTNTAGDAQARMAEGARHLRTAWGESLSEDAVAVVMGVEPEYMAAAFAAIEAQHRSVDAYLAEVLEVTPERRDALRERLVA